ncbi:hypothetical protein DH2020_004698 [Rehmannia glutinosa]|uniref:DUF4283 domain-containing protein n=1 Tax=Rehmannia glutinosa TaxID=99300 RepID=A0ABR0XQ93_REHGL
MRSRWEKKMVIMSGSADLAASGSQTLAEDDPTLGLIYDGAPLTPSTEKSPASEDAQKVFDEKSKKAAAQAKAPWVGLFADNRTPDAGYKLKYVKPVGNSAVLDDEDIDDVNQTVGYCLVGYFPTRHPGKQALMALCKTWKVPFDYVPDINGWMVFKFKTEHDRDMVIRGGPYSVYGRPLLLKPLPKFFNFGDDDIKSVPVWINFPHLPWDFWNEKALEKIASLVGTPITTDRLTRTKGKMEYARVFVEVDVSKELVRSVNIIAKGYSYDQEVIYENEPKFCSKCNRIGHSLANQVSNQRTQRISNQRTKESKNKEPAQSWRSRTRSMSRFYRS